MSELRQPSDSQNQARGGGAPLCSPFLVSQQHLPIGHADAFAHEARGYAVRVLRSFPGMAIVGFPTLPLIQRLVTARDIVLEHQPRTRCCAVLPSRPDHALGCEYLPEGEVLPDRFAEIVEGIQDPFLHEAIDMSHPDWASGVCPV